MTHHIKMESYAITQPQLYLYSFGSHGHILLQRKTEAMLQKVCEIWEQYEENTRKKPSTWPASSSFISEGTKMYGTVDTHMTLGSRLFICYPTFSSEECYVFKHHLLWSFLHSVNCQIINQFFWKDGHFRCLEFNVL